MAFIKHKLLYLGIALCLATASYLCVLAPDTFTSQLLVQDIKEHLPSAGCEHLDLLVSQPFSYLGKGSQAIVFASADGEYVLKFFLTERFHTKLRIRRPFRKAAPPRIRWDVLERYATAFEKIKTEAGLVAIHLSANTNNLPHCTLKDPQGKTHVIDLNRFSFVLQKRCECLSETFDHMSSEEQHEVIAALDTLVVRLASKGFCNLRGSFKDENFAILDKKAIMIDVGNLIFVQAQKEEPDQEIERARSILHHWFCKKSRAVDTSFD